MKTKKAGALLLMSLLPLSMVLAFAQTDLGQHPILYVKRVKVGIEKTSGVPIGLPQSITPTVTVEGLTKQMRCSDVVYLNKSMTQFFADDYNCLGLLDNPAHAKVTIAVQTPMAGTLKFTRKLQSLGGEWLYATGNNGKKYSLYITNYESREKLENSDIITVYRVELGSNVILREVSEE